jgi:hypothetical protein
MGVTSITFVLSSESAQQSPTFYRTLFVARFEVRLGAIESGFSHIADFIEVLEGQRGH